MNRRGAVRAALLLIAVVLVGFALACPVTTLAATGDPQPEPSLPDVPVTVLDNEFIGENERFFEDCVGSSVQRPDCGSKGRGGWRQAIVLAAVVGGVGIVVLRIALGARRGRDGAPRAETG